MKTIYIIFTCLFFSVVGFSQDNINYKEYSYTEFFKLIEEEKDSVFKLNDARIIYNPKTDERFGTKINYKNEEKDTAYVHRNDIIINKHIELNNVHFHDGYIGSRQKTWGSILDVHFKKTVTFTDVIPMSIEYCRFDESFSYFLTNCDYKNPEFPRFRNIRSIVYSDFFNKFNYYSDCSQNLDNDITTLKGNSFKSKNQSDRFLLLVRGSKATFVEKNSISNFENIFLSFQKSSNLEIIDNSFDSGFILFANKNQEGQLVWKDNYYSVPLILSLDPFLVGDELDWNQFEKGFASSNSFNDYMFRSKNTTNHAFVTQKERTNLVKEYVDSVSVYDAKAFANEMSLKSLFYTHYKSRYNTQIANKVYIDLKDFETQRLKIEHDQNPGFRTYFKWKVNQFLKLFSDYGTEPSKAIVVSVYVILLFAFIYLLFPNSWDTLGNRRLMSRFEFFQKYLRRKEGMHTIYLEGKKDEISSYEDFKTTLENSKTELPSFFISWSKPLYNASMFSSKLTSRFLQNTDILKGKWKDLSPKQKRWKNIQIGFLLTLGLVYDLFIKALNALMLSINTFTTLGFGEIPIKGLPRYLAIIQGFIGWFMLTIFSVSLISQLLN